MEIISVVYIVGNAINDMQSYTNNAEAEEQFKTLVRRFSPDEVSDEDMEELLDDGYFELPPEYEASVCLTHSFVNDPADELPAYMRV